MSFKFEGKMAEMTLEFGREDEAMALLSCSPSFPTQTENSVVKSESETAVLQIKTCFDWNRRAGRWITRPIEESTGYEVSSLRMGLAIQSKEREESAGSFSIFEIRADTEFMSEGEVVKLMAEP